ncbi:MAG: hypothetical protein H7Y41_06020, partial [Hyphomonadaceae bacterium]|nr:hypothetical protein [Clostridia bacterium]
VSNATIENTLEILKKNDVTIDRTIIPVKMAGMPILSMQKNAQNKVFENFMGISWHKTQEGNVTKYVSDDKVLTVRENDFNYIDTNPTAPYQTLDENIALSIATNLIDKNALANLFGGEKRVLALPNGSYVVIVHQLHAGKNIFGQDLTITLTPQGITEIKGGLLTASHLSSEKYPVRHVTGVLIDFIHSADRPKQPTAIRTITLGYYVGANYTTEDVKVAAAVPAWEIVTLYGVYFYDATNGAYLTKVPK